MVVARDMMVARREKAVVVVVVVLLLCGLAGAEEEECMSAYNYLAGCLTFVSGPDVVPNAVCCGGVNHLSTSDPHCLCTIIRELDSNPNVNFTKACALPYSCSAAVSNSECSDLLTAGGYPLAPLLPPGYMPPLPGDGESAAEVSFKPRVVVAVASLLVFFFFFFL